MAQEDYAIADQAGTPFLADLNNQLLAIVSNNSGATAPATTFAYQWWCDTTTGLLKIRNAANSGWVTVGTLSATNFGLATLASPTFTGTVTIPTLALTNDLSIANGGTGQSTAAAAFAALKQAATTSATGVVELATDAEAMAGTDTTRALTPSNIASGFAAGTIAYMKLPGGLLLQWGYHAKNADVPTGFATYQNTFPIAFSQVYLVCPVIRRENNIVVSWDSAGTTNTYASFFVREVVSGVQSAWDIAYLAIGLA